MQDLVELWRQFMPVTDRGEPSERNEAYSEFKRLTTLIGNKMKELGFVNVSLGYGYNKSQHVLDTIKENFNPQFLFKNDYYEFYQVDGLLVLRQQVINHWGPNGFFTFVIGSKKNCEMFKERVKNLLKV